MLDHHAERAALASVLAYVTLVFGAWIVYVSTLYPSVENTPSLPLRILLNDFIRASIFVAPVFFYLKFIAHAEPFLYLKLSTNILRGVRWGVIVSVAYAALVLARVLLFTAGSISPQAVPIEAWLTSLTVSPLIEEVAFRGFLLQRVELITRFWVANTLAACLFVAIHFPGWIIVGGSALVSDKAIAMGEVLFLGLLSGYVFKRSRSLWACVIVHAANNLIATMLF